MPEIFGFDAVHNLAPVILGNLFGGSVPLGPAYEFIYRRKA
jgi:formate/nitrite transporter FocA (FNT family)